jgi:hypothetical protein
LFKKNLGIRTYGYGLGLELGYYRYHKQDNLRHIHGNVHWIAGGLDALHGRAVGHQLLPLGIVPASNTGNG